MNNRPGTSEVFRRDPRDGKDPYEAKQKHPSNTRCDSCDLVFVAGVWRAAPAGTSHVATHTATCPACRRIRDDYPGGILRLGGAFTAGHREDILNRVRSLARQAQEEHPLQRLMRTEESGGEVAFYFTDGHVPVRIGKALRRDYGGDLDITYGRSQKFATARWTREE